FYALALIGPATLLAVVVMAPHSRRLDAMLPDGWRLNTMLVARASVAAGGFVAVIAAVAIDARWIMTPAFGLAIVFYALDALGSRERMAAPGLAIAMVGLCASIVFGLDASAEYYAFALIVPPMLVVAAERTFVGGRIDAAVSR